MLVLFVVVIVDCLLLLLVLLFIVVFVVDYLLLLLLLLIHKLLLHVALGSYRDVIEALENKRVAIPYYIAVSNNFDNNRRKRGQGTRSERAAPPVSVCVYVCVCTCMYVCTKYDTVLIYYVFTMYSVDICTVLIYVQYCYVYSVDICTVLIYVQC